MKQQVLLDTGTLVAFINPRDNFHSWAVAEWDNVSPPLLTCEAVFSEACFLLRKVQGGKEAVITLLENSIIQIP